MSGACVRCHRGSNTDCEPGACEAVIGRAELDRDYHAADIEGPDQWGRDADWNWPRGYGGNEPW